MRRHLVLAALALAACAKTETPADTTAAAAPAPPPALTAADLAGTWDQKVMPMNNDSVVATTELTATATADGWTMKIPGNASPVPVRNVVVAGDSVVSETGPYNSVTRRGQKVSIHSIQRLKNGQLTGVVHARWANGDTATFRVTGTKKP